MDWHPSKSWRGRTRFSSWQQTLSPTFWNWKGKFIPLDFPTFNGKKLSSQNILQRNDVWLTAQLGGNWEGWKQRTEPSLDGKNSNRKAQSCWAQSLSSAPCSWARFLCARKSRNGSWWILITSNNKELKDQHGGAVLRIQCLEANTPGFYSCLFSCRLGCLCLVCYLPFWSLVSSPVRGANNEASVKIHVEHETQGPGHGKFSINVCYY